MEAVTGSRPAGILARVNRFIAVDLHSTLFLSAFYASLDVHSGEMAFANGGHNWPLWLRAGEGACQELSARGIVLGAFADMEFEQRRIEVAPGDVLVFFTDGVTEAMDQAGRMFEDEQLQATVMAHRDASAEQLAQAIVDAVKAFTGDTPQSDDLTLFVVKRQAAGS
jgi:sigma-B regulation protein RsbU (phosphoserine phosphatase)